MQQFSVDLQRELPGHIAVVGRLHRQPLGAAQRGRHGGRDGQHQPARPEYLSLGTALQQTVANPFFGNAAFGTLSRSATIARGQLLRPYPQFGNVFAHRVTEAKARYHSMVLKAEQRIADGWGARVNYTFSRLKDNQFGETNFFANRGALLDNYDLDREYGLSLLDTPHRVNITGTFELPFGEGKRWIRRAAW